MLVIGAKSTKIQWLLRSKEGSRGMCNNKMSVASLNDAHDKRSIQHGTEK